MGAGCRDGVIVGLCLMALVVVGSIGAEAQLTTDFYDESCPQIYDIVKAEIQQAVKAEARNAAFLVRLHFHDCFVNGCDGSILLDNTTDFISEQYSLANNKSIGGLNLIADIKAKLEAACPQTVSCADIIAIASRDSAVEVGLVPSYPVFFGRRDSLTANKSAADQFLPAPSLQYHELVKNFKAVGLDETDLVALSGAHTIGRVSCRIVRQFLNDTLMNPLFRDINGLACPNSDFNVTNLDLQTPDKFDLSYYQNLIRGEGILHSDQVLFSTPGFNVALVLNWAIDQRNFFNAFIASTIKMGNISPLLGDEGEVRVNCSVRNPDSHVAPLVASQ